MKTNESLRDDVVSRSLAAILLVATSMTCTKSDKTDTENIQLILHSTIYIATLR
jgi:hypothetical protein